MHTQNLLHEEKCVSVYQRPLCLTPYTESSASHQLFPPFVWHARQADSFSIPAPCKGAFSRHPGQNEITICLGSQPEALVRLFCCGSFKLGTLDSV